MIDDPVNALVSTTFAMHAAGKPLMRRFIPPKSVVRTSMAIFTSSSRGPECANPYRR
jgi:hypothetical protein